MELSGAEKLILIMLCEIYEKLGIDAAINPAFVKQAISKDQLWAFGWKYPDIKESADPPIVQEVADILQMWSLIEGAYEKLSSQDKEGLKHEAVAGVQFKGFDVNGGFDDEEKLLGVAQFLIDDLERFPRLKGRDLNSHSPTRKTYCRMLDAFEPINKKLEDRPLSVAELTQILKAQKQPE